MLILEMLSEPLNVPHCFVALLLLLVVAIMTGWWTALSYQVRASELKFVFGQ